MSNFDLKLNVFQIIRHSELLGSRIAIISQDLLVRTKWIGLLFGGTVGLFLSNILFNIFFKRRLIEDNLNFGNTVVCNFEGFGSLVNSNFFIHLSFELEIMTFRSVDLANFSIILFFFLIVVFILSILSWRFFIFIIL